MKNELVIKRCMKCGAVVKVMEDCHCENCGIMCCGEEMQVLTANSVDAAIEKHVPTYVREGDKIKVKVNHVMEDEHYIEWICLKTGNREEYVNLEPNKDAVAEFSIVQTGTLYAYCNKHGLWSVKIDE